MTTSSNNRWITALHEAGHAVVTIKLDGICLGACLTSDDTGLCQTARLLRDSHVTATAAGPAAEQLASRHSPPDVETELPTMKPSEIESNPEFLTTLGMAAQTLNQIVSDARFIAEWAIEGREDDPEMWVQRAEDARRKAERHIRENEAEIVRVAELLFIHGSLTGRQILEGIKHA